jgi:glycosyltransferase involved in cell wall biosynthesis
MQPLVTIFMPVYNAESFLAEAIESILNQTFSDFQLLIINDGSKDASAQIIAHYVDRRIRVINHDKNMGLIASLNEGIALAKTKYLARMDADDISLPRRIERQIVFLESHPEIAACGTWAEEIVDGRPGQVIKPFAGIRLERQYWRPVPILHPTACLRTKVIQKLRYRSEMLLAEDYDLWLRMKNEYQIANLPQVLLKYRIHANNVSKLGRQTQLSNSRQAFGEHFPDIVIDQQEFEALIAASYLSTPLQRMRLKHRLRTQLPSDPFWSLRDDLLYAARWLLRRQR